MSYWIDSRDEFYVQTGAMHENPFGVPVDEIRRLIKENPPEIVAQVVFGKFVDNSGLVFSAELLSRLFDHSLPRVMGNEWIDEKRWRQGQIDQKTYPDQYRYATGVDLARKNDYTVICTIDTNPHPARLVYFKRLNRVPWPSIYAEIGKAMHLFGGELLIDGTGAGGDVILEELEGRLYCPKHHLAYEASGSCPGGGGCAPIRLNPESFIYTASTKVQLINHLQSVLGYGYDSENPGGEFGRLRCPPIAQLEEELSVYTFDDKKLVTDCVMALALAAWQGLEELLPTALAESVHGS